MKQKYYIATVRIAPVERWCHWYAPPPGKEEIAAKLVGMPFAIYPASMRPAECDPQARMWDGTQESWARVKAIIGKLSNDPRVGICEHVLEMD